MILNDETLAKFGYKSHDVGKFSKRILVAKCDHCGKIFEKTSNQIQMCRRNSKSDIDICTDIDCLKWKRENTMLKKFGVRNAGLSTELREKVKSTCRKKFGVEHPMSSPIVQQMSKNGCKQRYGVENAFQSDVIKLKIKADNLQKYGVEYTSQRVEVKEKTAKTFHDRWHGCGNASPDIYKKTKATCQKRYGGVGLSSPQLYKKARNTSRCKYGKDFPSQSDFVKKKIMDAHIKRYGRHYFQTPEFKETRKKTNIEKYGQENPILEFSRRSRGKISKFQREVYAYVLVSYPDAIMEKPISDTITSDIFIPSINCVIECKGTYWHCDPRRYQFNFYNKNRKQSAQEIWNADAKRESIISNQYRLITIWESDWKMNRNIEI